MSFKNLLLLLFSLISFTSLGQRHYLQARLGVILNVPQVEVLNNTGNYQIRSGKPLVGLKLGYTYFNQRNLGFSLGLQVTGKQYVIYEERRQTAALLQSFTILRYYTFSLPLAFEYRGNPFSHDVMPYYRRRFFSFSAGLALAYTKETSITMRSRGKGSNIDFSYQP